MRYVKQRDGWVIVRRLVSILSCDASGAYVSRDCDTLFADIDHLGSY